MQTQTLDIRDSMPSHKANTEMKREWKQAEIREDSPARYVTAVYSVAFNITDQGQTKYIYILSFF